MPQTFNSMINSSSSSDTVALTAMVILASAFSHLFPSAQLLFGESTELGFYYDFIVDQPVDKNFISLIEEKMRGLMKQNLPIFFREMMRENAANFFIHKGQPFKAEQVLESPINIVKIVEIGDFFDYGHDEYLEATGELSVFKILSIENSETYLESHGAVPTVRVEGVAFEDSKKLKEYFKNLKSKNHSDHQVLANQIELFLFDEKISNLGPVWLHKGALLRDSIYSRLKEEQAKRGDLFVRTPSLINTTFVEKAKPRSSYFPAGKFENFSYSIPESPFGIHTRLFQAKERFEEEFPLRYSEVREVYSKQNQPWGLFKTSSYTMDFTSTFCQPERLCDELISCLQFIDKMVKMLGFECYWSFLAESSRTKSRKNEQVFSSLCKALDEVRLSYDYKNSQKGEAGFCIEGIFIDQLKRRWLGPSIKIDELTPKQLNLSYVSLSGQLIRPVLLKSTIYGPIERLLGLLLEKDGGYLPLWLAPEQVRVLTLSSKQEAYGQELVNALMMSGIRATKDNSDSQLGARIHNLERAKVPYGLIVGDQEEREKMVSVRKCGKHGKVSKMSFAEFLGMFTKLDGMSLLQ